MKAQEAEQLAAPVQPRYQGVAIASFDGVLKLVNLLGQTQRAVLVLTAGGRQIDCGVDSLSVDQLRAALNRRVMAYGRAHYSSDCGLPHRLEVTKADPVKSFEEADLARWRGSFDMSGYRPDEEFA